MKRVAYIDPNLCDMSPACPSARVCPVQAIYREGFFTPSIVNADACIGCSKCVHYCPAQAVTIIEKTEEIRHNA